MNKSLLITVNVDVQHIETNWHARNGRNPHADDIYSQSTHPVATDREPDDNGGHEGDDEDDDQDEQGGDTAAAREVNLQWAIIGALWLASLWGRYVKLVYGYVMCSK